MMSLFLKILNGSQGPEKEGTQSATAVRLYQNCFLQKDPRFPNPPPTSSHNWSLLL